MTAIASTIHPELGLLITVAADASSGARPFCDPLPARCQSQLRAALEAWAVDGRPGWFYATDVVVEFLDAYVALVDEAATFTPAAAIARHQLLCRVHDYLAENPGATATAVWREIGGRKAEVLRAVRLAREPVPSGKEAAA